VAQYVFWAMLLLLVNGWVDFANHALTNKQYSLSSSQFIFDDFDTCYEWIAEEIFGVENAIPEEENGSDEQGSTQNLKITLAFNEGFDVDILPPYYKSEFADLILSRIPYPFIAGWVHPPNV
jgi:hypothetical protein